VALLLFCHTSGLQVKVVSQLTGQRSVLQAGTVEELLDRASRRFGHPHDTISLRSAGRPLVDLGQLRHGSLVELHQTGLLGHPAAQTGPTPNQIRVRFSTAKDGPFDQMLHLPPGANFRDTLSEFCADHKVAIRLCQEVLQQLRAQTPEISKFDPTMDFDALPDWLTQLGVKLFGSQAAMDEVVGSSKLAQVRLHGQQLWLRARATDSAWRHLEREGSEKHSEIFHKRFNRSGVFVELGANLGANVIYGMMMNPGMRAVALEPTPEGFFFLQWNLHANLIPQWRHGRGAMAMQRAISTDGQPVEFQITTQSSRGSCAVESMSDLMHATRKNKYNSSVLSVPSITLQQLMQHAEISRIALIRMDCEGCEYFLIPAWHQLDLISTIQKWSYEVHPAHSRQYDAATVRLTYDVLMKASNTLIQLQKGEKLLQTLRYNSSKPIRPASVRLASAASPIAIPEFALDAPQV